MARTAYVPAAVAALLLQSIIALPAASTELDGRWMGEGLMGGDINECDGVSSLDLDFEVHGPAIVGRFKAGHYGWINIDGTVNEGGVVVMKSSFANFRGSIDATSGAGKGKFDTAFGCGGLFELKQAR